VLEALRPAHVVTLRYALDPVHKALAFVAERAPNLAARVQRFLVRESGRDDAFAALRRCNEVRRLRRDLGFAVIVEYDVPALD
jgi:hypothetical protein